MIAGGDAKPWALRIATLLASVAGVVGCGGLQADAEAGGAVPPRPAMGAGWVAELAPFDVLDVQERPYETPFLGGFDVPRPQLVDIDGDGDDDLFIQEETDRLLFFEADPAEDGGAGLRYRHRPDRFADLEIGEWYRFADADGDGDYDLFAEQPFSYVRLYRNIGDVGRPAFEVLADTLRDTRGAPIFSDRQNIPNMTDIDCDGRLDILIGRLVGTITHYEATGVIGSEAVPFQHLTDRFENIEIVADPSASDAPNPATDLPGPIGARSGDGALRASSFPWRPTAMHGANTMAFVDIDRDGDVDLFWGDFFEAGLLFIENSGSCESPDFVSEPVAFPTSDPLRTSGYNAPTFGDVDGDGTLDLLVGALGGAFNPNTTLVQNLIHIGQDSGGVFAVESRRFVSQIDVGSESAPELADLDGDGDLDLVVGSRIDPDDLETSALRWFENAGTPDRPAFIERGDLSIAGAYHGSPAFGDLDEDGDLDLILGTWEAELRFFENIGASASEPGSPRFELVDSAFVALSRGSNATPTLGDVDGDGDLDLLVGEASGSLNLFENVGDDTTPRFGLVSDEYLDIDVGRRSAPALHDLDGDGDLDLVIGSEADGLHLYENRGDRSTSDFVAVDSELPARGALSAFVAPAFGDLDGRGSPELLVGGAGGGLRYFRSAPSGTPPDP